MLVLCSNRTDLDNWIRNVEIVIRSNKEAGDWLVDLLAGEKGQHYLKLVLNI